jgi:NAD(P)-dependent dehydrogenase (short-subunit alcohol dehydrogenase family)
MTERLQEAVRFEAKMRNLSFNDVLAQRQSLIPLRRYATVEDVANLALFLASEKATYINGVIVPLDGGLTSVL